MPKWFDEPPDRRALDATFPVSVACVASFFTNARLAAEFFWKMPKHDITARWFVPDWNVPDSIATRMERVWLMASKHVVHLSQDRVPSTPTDWKQEDLSLVALTRINSDAFEALRLFADAYERQGGAYAEWLRQMCEGTRPRTMAELARGRNANIKPPPVVIEWW